LIDFAADNPYALEIRYHHKCWLKYVCNYQRMSDFHTCTMLPFVKLKLSFLTAHIPTLHLETAEKSEEDKHEETDEEQEEGREEDSELSEEEWSDLNYIMQYSNYLYAIFDTTVIKISELG